MPGVLEESEMTETIVNEGLRDTLRAMDPDDLALMAQTIEDVEDVAVEGRQLLSVATRMCARSMVDGYHAGVPADEVAEQLRVAFKPLADLLGVSARMLVVLATVEAEVFGGVR